MAVVIRLRRDGAKHKPYYHVVVTDSRNPRDGKFIEVIGAYDASKNPPFLEINPDRLTYWQKNGAKLSERISALVKSVARMKRKAA